MTEHSNWLDFERLDIIRFDHTLFKTPVINYELFTPDTRDLLMDRSPGNPMNWYNDVNFLQNGQGKFKSYDASPEEMWNLDLCELINKNRSDFRTGTVLYCDRPPTGAFIGSISRMIRKRGLHIDIFRVVGDNTIEWLIEWLLKRTGNIKEISYYANRDVFADDLLVSFMEGKHRNIDFFRIDIGFQFSFLEPSMELRWVISLVRYVNHTQHLQMTVAKSKRGSSIFIDKSSRISLLRMMISKKFIPEIVRDTLKYDCSKVMVTDREASWTMRKLVSRHSSMSVNIEQIGSVPGMVYALRARIPEMPKIDYFYGPDPIVIAAYNPSIKTSDLPNYVRQITKWEPFSYSATGTLRLEEFIKIRGLRN